MCVTEGWVSSKATGRRSSSSMLINWKDMRSTADMNELSEIAPEDKKWKS